MLTQLAAAPLPAQPGPASGSDDDLANRLRQHGLRAVAPPTPATDFTLPTPGGARVSLSDYQGTWVLLTFWATWCGPCRVEMPSLERLHRDKASSGFTVLGVSVDDDLRKVEPFVRQLGLTFPNLWDEKGQVAAAYRAASIPLSYLIDPSGRLVAMSRGARDWGAMETLIDAALERLPPGGDAHPVYGTAGGPVELPSVLEPPTADLAISEPRPLVGRPFYLDIRLHWAGHFEEYLPHPPRVHLPEAVEQRSMTASTSSREGGTVVDYRVELAAREAGTFALDPVDLEYTPRGETEPVSSRLVGPTVEVRTRTLFGLSPWIFALAAGGLTAAGALALGLLWRRRSSSPGAAAAEDRYGRLRRRLEEARALRIQGDPRGAFLALSEIEAELTAGDGEETDTARRQRLEAVRYGGSAPAAEELNPMERRIGRLVGELAPDPEQASRQDLKLRREEAEAATGGSSQR